MSDRRFETACSRPAEVLNIFEILSAWKVLTLYFTHREEPEVVSPVKVTLTPAKEGSQEENGGIKVEEEVTLVEDMDKDSQVKSLKKPKLWEVELMLTEQTEGEDENDPEYVPPSTCLDISLDYDEVNNISGVRIN